MPCNTTKNEIAERISELTQRIELHQRIIRRDSRELKGLLRMYKARQ